jgi:putative FmdB family regulatory protein
VPTYDYQCRACGAVTEVIHSMLDDGPTVCERCGGELRRILYPAGIIFKGPGFYSTDSRSGASKSIAGSSSSAGSSSAPSTGTPPPSTDGSGSAGD